MDRYQRGMLLLVIVLTGCNDRGGNPVEATSTTTAADVPEDPLAKYEQPFAKAATDEVGVNQLPPVDQTVAGKSTAKLREEVERLWPTIKLLGPDEKPLPWTVKLETEAGTIEIALRPDLAPNHVRNFIALTKAGYYDGLHFDRIVNQKSEAADGTKSEIRLVQFGCPAGTGDAGSGHIGYRLKSEFSGEKHVAGTVGFTRDEDPNSSGTKLHILLGPAPVLDGSYTIVGKVVQGMSAVDKIASGKLLSDQRELPEKPIVIRKATAEYK